MEVTGWLHPKGSAVDAVAAGEFQTFGTSHLVMLALFAAGVWAVARIGRTLRGTPAERRFSRGFALAIPVFTIPLQVVDFLPGRYSFQTTLPLQLCDFAWLAVTYALRTHSRYAAALSYYWGITLTTQALATPALASDFPDPKFVAYWAMHILIVWAAVYLTWGLGLRPSWRGYRSTVLTTLAWAVAVFVFNAATGANYGFLNRKPTTPSVLDLMGPWPWYVALEVALVLSVWALMTWPWVRSSKPASLETRGITGTSP